MAYLVKQVGPVRPLLAKIQAVLHFRVPRTRCEIRRDLGMAGYYRGFCKKFADVVAPLTSLTGVSKCGHPHARNLFSLPKLRIPVFATLDFMRPFKLQVDARASCAGEVLLQKDEQGVDHPIGYF